MDDDLVILLDPDVYGELARECRRLYGASVEEFFAWCFDLAWQDAIREADARHDPAQLVIAAGARAVGA